MRISDWSSDVCSSDRLVGRELAEAVAVDRAGLHPHLARFGHVAGEFRVDAVCSVSRHDISEFGARGLDRSPMNVDRKSVVSVKSVSVRVDLGGGRIINKNKIATSTIATHIAQQ